MVVITQTGNARATFFAREESPCDEQYILYCSHHGCVSMLTKPDNYSHVQCHFLFLENNRRWSLSGHSSSGEVFLTIVNREYEIKT